MIAQYLKAAHQEQAAAEGLRRGRRPVIYRTPRCCNATPLIGRPAPHSLRELVISKGQSGYVALYRFLPSKDRIEILAICHQRESGFVD